MSFSIEANPAPFAGQSVSPSTPSIFNEPKIYQGLPPSQVTNSTKTHRLSLDAPKTAQKTDKKAVQWTPDAVEDYLPLRRLFMPATRKNLIRIRKKYFTQPGLSSENCIQIGSGFGDFLREGNPKLHALMTHTDASAEMVRKFKAKDKKASVSQVDILSLDKKYTNIRRIFGSLVLDTLSFDALKKALTASYNALGHHGALIHVIDLNAALAPFFDYFIEKRELILPIENATKFWHIHGLQLKKLQENISKDLLEELIKNPSSVYAQHHEVHIQIDAQISLFKRILGDPTENDLITFEEGFHRRIHEAIAAEQLNFSVNGVTIKANKAVKRSSIQDVHELQHIRGEITHLVLEHGAVTRGSKQPKREKTKIIVTAHMYLLLLQKRKSHM